MMFLTLQYAYAILKHEQERWVSAQPSFQNIIGSIIYLIFWCRVYFKQNQAFRSLQGHIYENLTRQVFRIGVQNKSLQYIEIQLKKEARQHLLAYLFNGTIFTIKKHRTIEESSKLDFITKQRISKSLHRYFTVILLFLLHTRLLQVQCVDFTFRSFGQGHNLDLQLWFVRTANLLMGLLLQNRVQILTHIL